MKKPPDNNLDDTSDVIEMAAAVLQPPLPRAEPDLLREIARRSDEVADILNRHRRSKIP